MLDLEIEKIYFSIQTDNNTFSNKIYKILHEITRNSEYSNCILTARKFKYAKIYETSKVNQKN